MNCCLDLIDFCLSLSVRQDRSANSFRQQTRSGSSYIQALENDATMLGNENPQSEGDIIEFSYSELVQATFNFHETNIIGKGGFGVVYRGKLRGIERAIKILKEQDHASKLTKEEDRKGKVDAYEHEVKILSKVKHPNIIRLIGTCKEKFVLVYELMSGGNLHKCLQNLYWKDRLRLVIEICSVLSFIHNSRPEVLVHGDLKPENILLDSNRTSKLCDFGTSRLILVNPEKTAIHHKTAVKGTQGYLDPSLWQIECLAPSSDVYSFGMLLLHVLTKRQVVGLNIVVEDAIDGRSLGALLDEDAGWPYQLAEDLSKIALRCCKYRPRERPDIDEVRKQLEEMKQENYEKFSATVTIFSFIELEQATSCFSESHMIGRGSFGTVYKGNLRDNEVAIKLPINFEDACQAKAFFQEVDILGMLEHANLVHLIGICPEKFSRVYEFMPGGNLEDRLNRKDLLWKDRLRIATEVCATLVYLHSREPNVIVHRDVNPTNILLDKDGVSKLHGFGISRITSKSSRTYTTPIQGSYGYRDPITFQTPWVVPSVDVYSFGMVLLRLLTKERVGFGLISMVEDALEEQNLEDLLEDTANWPYQLAEQLSKLALRCCCSRPKLRPNTAEILENLEQMKEYLTS